MNDSTLLSVFSIKLKFRRV